jgi:excisionase family DNA binding protein
MNEQLKQIRELIKELDATPILLTYREAADILGIAPQTLRTWVCYGKISYVKIGSAVRFTRDHLDEFIEQSTRRVRK